MSFLPFSLDKEVQRIVDLPVVSTIYRARLVESSPVGPKVWQVRGGSAPATCNSKDGAGANQEPGVDSMYPNS